MARVVRTRMLDVLWRSCNVREGEGACAGLGAGCVRVGCRWGSGWRNGRLKGAGYWFPTDLETGEGLIRVY